MVEESRALRMLLAQREAMAVPVAEDLVHDVFAVEDRVQFDDDRREAAAMIQRLVRARVDEEIDHTTEPPTNATA